MRQRAQKECKIYFYLWKFFDTKFYIISAIMGFLMLASAIYSVYLLFDLLVNDRIMEY
jgi:hypothetical protein